jgi:drug/metabolite transporter (DMT)-like permease
MILSHATLGFLLALGALVLWGFGDFSIQRSVRAVGIWKSLLFIGVFGMVLYLPFAWTEIPRALSHTESLWLLAAACVTVLFAAFFNFDGMKIGKLSVVAPVTSLELPLTVILGFLVLGEWVSTPILCTIIIIFIGVLFVAMHDGRVRGHRWFEKGVLFGLLGAVGLATFNILLSIMSRTWSSVFAIWFTHTFLSLFSAIMITKHHGWKSFRSDVKKHRTVLCVQALFDNAAWVCYGAATTYIPVAVATAVSENFVALAAVLGVIYNKERLHQYQKWGIAIGVIGLVMLGLLERG